MDFSRNSYKCNQKRIDSVPHSWLLDNTETLEGLLCFHCWVPCDSRTGCYVRSLINVQNVIVFVEFIRDSVHNPA